MVFQTIYVSSAAFELSRDDVYEILETSRLNNSAAGLTGMLLYHDGNFIQVLEGERKNVLSTLSRIERDTRHRGVIRLIERDIDEREFGSWSMGFVSSDAIVREHEAFSDFLMAVDHAGSDGAGYAQRLLQNFRSTRR